MDVLLDEVESLEAILMDDVRIFRNSETGAPEIIETTIFPSVENDSEELYVCVNLQVIPTKEYPEESPKFNLQKPRGLDDCRLDEIRLACLNKLKETQGFPVVFDLIEVVREHLSGSNLPCGQCVVCLYGFHDGDEFTKTECYHYLHSYCLARHLIAARKNYQEEQDKLPAWIRKASEPFQASCPVCRETIKDDSETLKACPPPTELTNAPDFHLTDELVSMQKKMAGLFVQQKKRGGIIDIEAEEAPVISIEPECTPDERSKNLVSESSNYFKEDRLPTDNNALKKSGCSGETSIRNQKPAQGRKPNHANNELNRSEANSSTNFAPVVAPSQRIASDPTNNNYHHHHSNRRHFRGRRHHHQHQHSENTHASHARPISPSPGHHSNAPNPQSNSNNKQQKGLANCSASTR